MVKDATPTDPSLGARHLILVQNWLEELERLVPTNRASVNKSEPESPTHVGRGAESHREILYTRGRHAPDAARRR